MRIAAACLVVVMGCAPLEFEEDMAEMIELQFPLGGMARDTAVQRQRPFTTFDCTNVRGRDTVEGRDRGGSRPMLSKAVAQQFESGAAIRMINSFRAGSSNRRFVEWFDGNSLSGDWFQWDGGASGYSVSGGYISSRKHVDTTAQQFVRSQSTFDDTADYAFEADIYSNGATNKYYITFQRDGASTDPALANCYAVEVVFNPTYSTDGSMTITVYKANASQGTVTFNDSDGTTAFKTVRVEVDVGNSVKVYWRGTLRLTVAAHTTSTNAHFGFGFDTGGGADTGISEFRFYYTSTGTGNSSRLILSANGDFYVEQADGTFAVAAPVDAPAATDQLQSAEHLGSVYIVGSDNPQYYDGSDGLLHDWSEAIGTNGVGLMPDRPHLICQWGGRIVVSGGDSADSHTLGVNTGNWYMSRIDNPFDWDFSANEADAARAVAGTASDDARVADAIVALIPWTRDYLVFGCANSMWMLVGNPAGGGQMVRLSPTIGIVGPNAWCVTADGTLVFLSPYGIHAATPGSAPEPLSNRPLPRELQNTDAANYIINMAYDIYDEGIYLFITPVVSTGTRTHWFIDWKNRAMWPFTYPAAMQPTAVHVYDGLSASGSKVLMGGSDGYVRRHRDDVVNDDGTAVSSYVYIGPFLLGTPIHDGIVSELHATLAIDSNNVSWELRVGATAEEATTATARDSGTWEFGRNHTDRPRVRGMYGVLKLSATSTWAMEGLAMLRETRGRYRQ